MSTTNFNEELMHRLERSVTVNNYPSTNYMTDYDNNSFYFKIIQRTPSDEMPDGTTGYSVFFWRDANSKHAIATVYFPQNTSVKEKANRISQDILKWVSATRTKDKKENPIGYAVYHQTGAKEETFQDILMAEHNKDLVQIGHKTCCDSPLEVLKEIKSIIERADI